MIKVERSLHPVCGRGENLVKDVLVPVCLVSPDQRSLHRSWPIYGSHDFQPLLFYVFLYKDGSLIQFGHSVSDVRIGRHE